MNKKNYLRSMFITPEQAVELCRMNIDQSKSMFYWGRIIYGDNESWGLFLISDENEPAQYLCGDDDADNLYGNGLDMEAYVNDYYAAFNLSQLMQILQNEVMNMSLTANDTVNLSFCPCNYQYHELAEGFAQYLIGLINDEQFNDDQCNGALEIY